MFKHNDVQSDMEIEQNVQFFMYNYNITVII